jgi:hypothetical protein
MKWMISERKLLKLLLFGLSSAPKLRVKKFSSFDWSMEGCERKRSVPLEEDEAHWRQHGTKGCTWIELR